MSADKFNELKRELSEKHINVSDEWLQSTINSFGISANINVNHIYRKWLNSDLRMNICDHICCDHFSSNAFDLSLARREIHGFHCVQLISVENSSAPLIDEYNAFLELDDDKNEDLYSQTTEKEVEEFRAKSKVKGPRLLSFILTNGKCEFKAIEYKPIDFLNDSLPIGLKLLLKGPLEIQMGIMFLTCQNVEILG
ncbi:recQ-mediated genome instability protein 1-like protein, partial [Dinothrombium tinctorium]